MSTAALQTLIASLQTAGSVPGGGGMSANQRALNIGTGVESGDGDPLRVIFGKIANNLSDLDGRLISSTAVLGTLGTAARLNIGTAPGTVADGGALTAETARAIAVEALKAPLASPPLTGIPTAPTAAAGTGTNQIATTQFVATAVATGGAGGGTGTGGVATSRQILSGGLATGGGDLTADRTITVPKAAQSDVAVGTDDAKALTSLSVAAAFAAKAPLASPPLTGTPTAPTAAAGTNTTQLATTAFVGAAVSAVPVVQYATQTLTTAQQAQARANIGAGTGNGNGTASVTAYSISGASGYRRWSDGFIEQWGQTSVVGDTFITYPISFPNACKSAVASPLGNTSDALSCMVDSIGQSSFGARVRDVSAGGGITAPTATVAWHAVGY